METVDDLMTPGCANCAVKHLSAALAYIADGTDTATAMRHEILAARALVNLSEVPAGYRSHLPFAIGLMERAETEAMKFGAYDFAARVRPVRLAVIADGEAANVGEAVAALETVVGGAAIVFAHLDEAGRELQMAKGVAPVAKDILDTIARIDEIFFFRYEERKGGEEVMACKKKCADKGGVAKKAVAKKAVAKKGAKACAKGGKCK